jgi:hypothetical protein
MNKQPKKSAAVEAAEAALKVKRAELAAARDAIKALETDAQAAYVALREAKIASDAHLPRCNLVSVGWRTGKADPAGELVIVRQTPGGTLVVRRPGDDCEMKFKWSPYRNVFVDAAKRSTWASSSLELRNVPAQFARATQGTSE